MEADLARGYNFRTSDPPRERKTYWALVQIGEFIFVNTDGRAWDELGHG